MITRTHNKLFTPVQVGAITLKHRIVMPPLSRLRAEWPSGVPSDLMREYYSQRASDGGLIFTEATAVAASGRGYRGAPGIYSDEQVAGWKRITGAVHAKGGYMFAQLWHAGRTTHGRFCLGCCSAGGIFVRSSNTSRTDQTKGRTPCITK